MPHLKCLVISAFEEIRHFSRISKRIYLKFFEQVINCTKYTRKKIRIVTQCQSAFFFK